MARVSPTRALVLVTTCLVFLFLAGTIPATAADPAACFDEHGRLDADLLRQAGYPAVLPMHLWSLFTEPGAPANEPPAARDMPDGCWSGSFPSPDIVGSIYTVASYGGDLVVGGYFEFAGSERVNHIARFDGETWRPLGLGLNGGVSVLHVAPDGRLVAGGDFTVAGGAPANRIAAWDGSQWQAFGQGMDDEVQAMATFDGMLIAAGEFDVAGTGYANAIAAWNGADWQPLGPGLDDDVDALVVHDGCLVATGWFSAAGTTIVNGVAAWDGATWSNLGAGLNGGGHSACVHGADLVVGGYFDYAGTVPVDGVAAWTGDEWTALPPGPGNPYDVARVFDHEGLLLRTLQSSGGEPVDNLYALVGHQWIPWGWASPAYGMNEILDFAVHAGELHAVGWQSVRVRRDGAWERVRGRGFDDRIDDLIVHGDDVVAVGNFTYAGDGAAGGVAVLEDGAWSRVGAEGEISGSVRAATAWEGQLIVGGNLDLAGHEAVGLACWEGASWQPLGGGIPDGTVETLAVFDGDLWVGGNFHCMVGDSTIVNLAAFDGEVWSGHQASSTVNDLLVVPEPDGLLMVGGAFSSVADYSVYSPGIVGWNGASFLPLNDGSLDCYAVTALGWHDEVLYAGVAASGSGFVHAFDGVEWVQLGATDPELYSNPPSRLLWHDGGLFVAGSDMWADGEHLAGLGCWDGEAWIPIATFAAVGSSYEVAALLPLEGELLVGGAFNTVNGMPFNHMAAYTCGAPVAVPDGGRVPGGPALGVTCAPNPFNPRTVIAFDLPARAEVAVVIHDLAGRRVRTLIDRRELSAGRHEVTWTGRDASGRAAASGVYVCRVRAGGAATSRLLTMVR